MKFFATLLIFTLSFSITAQEKDTIFYNKYWRKTTKDKAFFYRPLPLQKEGNLFVLKDYYIDGKLQMKAYSSSNKKDIFEGKTTWYYENGQISSERNYIKNTPHGQEKSYFRDGALLSEGIYKSGKMFNGTFLRTNEQPMKTYTAENGEIIASSAYYQENKKVAYKYVYEGIKKLTNSFYYDKDGREIAKRDPFGEFKDLKVSPYQVVLELNENNNVEKVLFLQYKFKENGIETEVLKDKNLNIIGKGTYKNGKKFNGIFFDRQKQLQTYKNGTIEGECIFYDTNNREIGKGIYKKGLKFSGEFNSLYGDKIEVFENGKQIGVKSKNRYTKEDYYCSYKDDDPYNGEEISTNYLKVYKEGKIQKKTEFDYDTGKKKTETFYIFDGRYNYEQIGKKIFYKNGKNYTLNYKNGSPNNGVSIERFGYVTYKDGKYNGSYLTESRNFTETGTYKNTKKEGLVTTKRYGKTYKATFKNDNPFDGAYHNGSRLTRYKNGKKDGCGYKTFNNRNIPHDSLTICYKNNAPDGKVTYYKKGKTTNTGTYKNGKPFNGIFYDLYNTTNYKNGKKTKEVVLKRYNYYKKTTYFDGDNISKEVLKTFKKDTITYITTFKNGRPYNGKRMSLNKRQTIITLTSYKNGKKNGLETFYRNSFDAPFIMQYNYIDGKKQGKAQFRLKEDKTLYTANYKNNKPYNGITIMEHYNFVTKSKYKNGKILKKEYYPKSNYEKDKLTEILYKNNKPYNGIELFFNEKKHDRIAKVYKNGTLTETIFRLYNFKEVNNPNYQTRIYHAKNKDSLVSGGQYFIKPSFAINYSNKKKTSGKVVFFRTDTVLGTASFKKNKLNAIKLRWKENYSSGVTNSLKFVDNYIEHTLSLGDVEIRFQVNKLTFIQPTTYFYYLLKNNKPSSDATVTLLPENIISTVSVKNGKPYSGFMFAPTKYKKSYETILFKDGKIISRKNNITRQELIDKIKSLQK